MEAAEARPRGWEVRVPIRSVAANGDVVMCSDAQAVLRAGVVSLQNQDGTELLPPLASLHSFEVDQAQARIALLPTEAGDKVEIGFPTAGDLQCFEAMLRRALQNGDGSAFAADRDASSAKEYFKYYALLSQQQNMLTDLTRTATYQRAMHANPPDFKDKVVCDVGAGSGILSFFAVQSGARKVYAIEASDMADFARRLVAANHLEDKIVVIKGKCEEVEVPEPVDMIISEPLGVMLINERMLESFLYAKKWLKTGGKMFPSRSEFYVAPFSDEQLHMECSSKAAFWLQDSFFGVDLSALYPDAKREYFRQPAVEQVDPRCLMAPPQSMTFDFLKLAPSDLLEIDMPFSFAFEATTMVHGIASWFDVLFDGATQGVWLSTGPHAALTHWYQVRCLLSKPVLVPAGHKLEGILAMKANRLQSYDVSLSVTVPGTDLKASGHIHLKEPNFRFSGAPAPYAGVSTADAPYAAAPTVNGSSIGGGS